MGQTITTDAKSGAIVVALLAVITSLGMTHLWHLLTFIFHQSRANGRPRDGLFRHQQAILRTLPTPSSMMADSVMLWYAWRGVSERALGRSLAQISIAFLFAAASLVASIYSSWIVENSNLEVLVQSPHCGSPNISTAIGNFHSFLNPISAAAEEYAMACYKKNGSLPSRCNIFSRPTVDSTTTEVPCPFDDKMCASPAIALDSGLVDVNVAFGLNLGDADRILYQRKTTCAILPLEGYTKVTTVSSDRSTPPSSGQGQLTEYLYGVSDFGIRDPSSPGDDIMVLSTKETLSMNGFDKR